MYYFLICLTLASSLCAQATSSQTVTENRTPEETELLKKQVTEALKAADAWVEIVDRGNYAEAWKAGALLMQQTMNEKEFEKLLNATRKPLGRVVSRTLADMRMGHNPPRLPSGDYMVVVYKTMFSTKQASELVTLYNVSEGVWKVLTYNVN